MPSPTSATRSTATGAWAPDRGLPAQGELARLLRTRRGPGDRDEARELIAQARGTAKALDMRTLAADLSALG